MKREVDLMRHPAYDFKDLEVKQHPRQRQIDEFRSIPSFWTGGKSLERIKNESMERNLGGNSSPAQSARDGQARAGIGQEKLLGEPDALELLQQSGFIR